MGNEKWRSNAAKLYKVKIHETEHNIVEYMGEGEFDESEGQLDVAQINLMGVDLKKNLWSLS